MEEEEPPEHYVLLVAEIFQKYFRNIAEILQKCCRNIAQTFQKEFMLLRYEDLKRDQEGMLRKIANFTGFVLTENQIQVV